MGQRVRRRRVGLRDLGPAAAPLRGHLHQWAQLSTEGSAQALEWRWCPGVILLALLPTNEPVPEATSALDPGHAVREEVAMTTATEVGDVEMRIAKVVGLSAADDERVHPVRAAR